MYKKILNVTLFTSIFMLGAFTLHTQNVAPACKTRLADCGCKKKKAPEPKPVEQLAACPCGKPRPTKPETKLAKCPCGKPKPAKPETQLADCGCGKKKPQPKILACEGHFDSEAEENAA